MKINFKKSKTKISSNWVILILASLTSVFVGIYRDGIASLFPFLQKDFNLSRAQLGLLFTFFYFSNAFFAIYTGRLVDLKGSKWGLVFSSLIMGILYMLHSISTNYLIILFMAALTGVIVSFNLPTVNKSIVEWFNKKQRSTAMGIQSMAFPMGGLFGALFLPFIGSLVGWRKSMILPGVITILYGLFLSSFYQDKRKTKSHNSTDKNDDSFWKSISQLIRNKELIKISFFGFFLGVMANSISAHFTLFLFMDYNLSEKIAGTGFAIVQLGSILGRAFWGIFCDRILGTDKRKTFLFMGTLFWFITIILSVGVNSSNLSTNILLLIAFLIGCFGNGWPGIFCSTITEIASEDNVGIAIGFSYLFIRTGMMVAPPIFGYIADLKNSYSLSWFLLGTIIFFVSFAQFYFKNNS